TLFRHFGSKELLFEEVLKRYTFLPKLKELLPELEGMSCEEALVLIATRFLTTLKERKSLIKIMYSEVTSYPDKIKEVYDRFIHEMRATLAAYFEDLKQRGILRSNLSAELAARLFLWILFSYFRSEEIMRPSGMKKHVMEKEIREMIDIYTHGTMNCDHKKGHGGERYAGN
ncbi:MAG TPA: TetR/AcrR family transcriptional regulator, partial [Nitrospirota bacterium]|nr:TetR/AcrR family transcriptional regulator [Nitrospirota bacterium]